MLTPFKTFSALAICFAGMVTVLIKSFGKDFDIIIDDGSHRWGDQQISFAYLFKCLNGL